MSNEKVKVTAQSLGPIGHMASIAGMAFILAVVFILGGKFAVWAGEALHVHYKWIVLGLCGIVVIVADHFHKTPKV